MICPRCDSTNIVKNGFKKLENKNVQKYCCNNCKKYFTGDEKFHRLSEKQKQDILNLQKDKTPHSKIANNLGVYLRTVQYFLENNTNKKEDF